MVAQAVHVTIGVTAQLMASFVTVAVAPMTPVHQVLLYQPSPGWVHVTTLLMVVIILFLTVIAVEKAVAEGVFVTIARVKNRHTYHPKVETIIGVWVCRKTSLHIAH